MKITAKTKFSEVMKKYPETFEVFLNEGMHCFGCGLASMETIEQGCIAHGINPRELVKKLNEKIKK
ncbi:DUF1858 domain-containing protein [Candidatus Pacearchaeota archaeon]|nr:DUF1858 domain-containing protein [Candidatus Pacearchaeota archaeon]